MTVEVRLRPEAEQDLVDSANWYQNQRTGPGARAPELIPTWMRAFLCTGLTVGGKTFWEIQFSDGTWMRAETASTRTSCEWTEPDGRCHRFEVRAIA